MRNKLFLLGANGFPTGAYLPLISELSKRGNIDVFTHNVYQEARSNGEQNWNPAINSVLTSLQACVEKVGSPVDVFGHSMGGALAILTATRRPDLFKRLIVFEPPCFSLEKRIAFSLIRRLGLMESLHPLSQATYRKQQVFSTREEAREYFATRRAFRDFDPRVLDALSSSECLVEYNPTIQATNTSSTPSFKLVFSASAERFFYKFTPFDIPLLDNPILGQYTQNSVPGFFLHPSEAIFLSTRDLGFLKTVMKNLKFIQRQKGLKGGHFTPFEDPDGMADWICQLLQLCSSSPTVVPASAS